MTVPKRRFCCVSPCARFWLLSVFVLASPYLKEDYTELGLGSRVVSFMERAAYWVYNDYVFFVLCPNVILVTSCFGFDGRINKNQ